MRPAALQRVCMKVVSQFGVLAGDKGGGLGEVVFAHDGVEGGE
jgi:hypothetical protein